MFIRRLRSVRDFRAFQGWVDDENDRPHTFGRVTLVFGPNGTGKTTLTEIAWNIQAHQSGDPAHPCLAGVKFELTDGKANSESAANNQMMPRLHVFGRSYVKKNLQSAFDEGVEGAALYVLGEKNVELEDQIRTKEAEVQVAEAEETTARSTLSDCERATRSILQHTKQGVNEELGSYDSARFNPNTYNVTKARALLGDARIALDAGRLESAKSDLRSRAEDIPGDLNFAAPLFSADLAAAAARCATYNVTSKAVEALASNPERAKWVEVGLPLHESGEDCAFCLSKIPPGRITELQRHFDESHKELKSKIQGVRELVQSERTRVGEWTALRETLANHSDAIRASLDEHGDGIDDYWAKVASWLSACEEMLQSRTDHPHESCSWDPPEPPPPTIWAPIQQASEAANAELQSRRVSLEKIRVDAEKSILAHIASKYGADFDQVTAKESAAKTRQDTSKTTLQTLQTTLNELTAKRASSNDGDKLASALTRDLVGYLGHADLSVEFAVGPERSGFEFKRAGAPATNLSEGERNAIALLHFLRSTDSMGVSENLSECCVVIDDPVSSLDHDAILAAYSFLNARLRDNGGNLRCKQLVLLTHNFEFFRLWKDSLSQSLAKDAKDAKDLDVSPHELPTQRAAVLELLMRRGVEEGVSKRSPMIRSFGTGLKALTSEYYYLFARACESTYPAGEDLLPLTGNSTRRLLESFLKFRLPAQNNFTQAADVLGAKHGIEPEVVSVVVKALHGASHREELDLHTATFRVGVIKEISKALEFMKRIDEPHFEGMCVATKWTPNPNAV